MKGLTAVVVLLLVGCSDGFDCPMSCFDIDSSNTCGFGDVKSCQQTLSGDVIVECEYPCSRITLDETGCHRVFTCGWWARMWDTLINVFTLLFKYTEQQNSASQYVIGFFTILLGGWMCFFGAVHKKASIFFIGFCVGALFGFAVGETYGFDGDSPLHLTLFTFFFAGVFCGGFMVENTLGYFVMGGLIPSLLIWFLIDLAPRSDARLAIVSVFCVIAFLSFGFLSLRRKRETMSLFTCFFGSILMSNGMVYFVSQENLRTCWSAGVLSAVAGGMLLPLLFFCGLYAQKSNFELLGTSDEDLRRMEQGLTAEVEPPSPLPSPTHSEAGLRARTVAPPVPLKQRLRVIWHVHLLGKAEAPEPKPSETSTALQIAIRDHLRSDPEFENVINAAQPEPTSPVGFFTRLTSLITKRKDDGVEPPPCDKESESDPARNPPQSSSDSSQTPSQIDHISECLSATSVDVTLAE